MKVISLVAMAALGASLSAAPATASDSSPNPWQARLIGEQQISNELVINGSRVGELSGIDYDRRTGNWYLISDDSELGPARFYTAKLALSESAFSDVRFTDGRNILRTDGSFFPSLESDDPEVADPEGIRFDPSTRTLWWSSEGKRTLTPAPQLVDPWVRQMTLSGRHIRATRQPSMFAMSASDVGPRRNGAFEGLALSTDGRTLVTSLETPLFQDGPVSTATNTSAHRITFYDKLTGLPYRQVAYELDALPGNGISEILAVDRHRYLVVERNFVAGVGNSIRVYEFDTRGATNVLHDPALADGGYRPVKKRLILDLASLGLDKVDNIEAVSWGPTLRTGERTLVFASDDNFNAPSVQVMQLFAVAVRPR